MDDRTEIEELEEQVDELIERVEEMSEEFGEEVQELLEEINDSELYKELGIEANVVLDYQFSMEEREE